MFSYPEHHANPLTGTLHAFAEARRGDVDGSHCPDIPDARLAYKRSVDGGASWSPLRILEEIEGRCRSQPTPVMDNVTDTLILAFNDDCSDFSHGNPTTPHLTTSTDDGLQWSNAAPMAVAKPGTGVFGRNVVIGLSRGLALHDATLPSKTRLIVPAETGTLCEDVAMRHGSFHPPPRIIMLAWRCLLVRATEVSLLHTRTCLLRRFRRPRGHLDGGARQRHR